MIGRPVPDAILLNKDDWGFGHFQLDAASVAVFEESLHNVESQIDRAVIISQFTAMMIQIEYPANRLLLVLNQLKQEQNQNLINAVVAALKQAINTYLSAEAVPSFSKACASFFFEKATSETDTKQ